MKGNISFFISFGVSFLVFFLLSFFLFLGYNQKNDYASFDIEVYSKVKVSDFLDKSIVRLVDDYYINTENVGNYKIDYSYYDEKGKITNSSFYLNIIDKEAPYVMLGNNYTHVIGNNFDLEKSLFYGDNVTKRPKVSIIGSYDLETVGEYPLIFRAEDDSGNVRDINFNLKVIEKKASTSSNSSYITFEELNNRLPKNASLMIDVSKWQEDIDWQEVYDNGIRYAMIRIGTQKGIDQDSRIDSYFEKNIIEAQKVGIKIGVYYFSYANDIIEAKEQANWVVSILKEYSLDLPVAFDWECWEFFDDFNLNFYELNKIADTFLKIIEDSGFAALIYGSKNYIENVWTYLDYDIWLAHYTKNTSYSGPMNMWQFTSSGKIPGIKGNVDVNFYYNK